MKHIEYSNGHFFLDDLRKDNQGRQENLDFTYNLNDQLKIDLEKIKEEKIKK